MGGDAEAVFVVPGIVLSWNIGKKGDLASRDLDKAGLDRSPAILNLNIIQSISVQSQAVQT
jgi:hypothetical protein